MIGFSLKGVFNWALFSLAKRLIKNVLSQLRLSWKSWDCFPLIFQPFSRPFKTVKTRNIVLSASAFTLMRWWDICGITTTFVHNKCLWIQKVSQPKSDEAFLWLTSYSDIRKASCTNFISPVDLFNGIPERRKFIFFFVFSSRKKINSRDDKRSFRSRQNIFATAWDIKFTTQTVLKRFIIEIYSFLGADTQFPVSIFV